LKIDPLEIDLQEDPQEDSIIHHLEDFLFQEDVGPEDLVVPDAPRLEDPQREADLDLIPRRE